MKSSTAAFFALILTSGALTQTLPPSPTASVGCEPHGDHWHCDGPATATTPTAAATTTHDDHDHETGTEILAPSPTESVGCEPHGDHWHCDGPRTSSGLNSTTTATTTGESSTSSPIPEAGAGRYGLSGVAATCVFLVLFCQIL